MKKLSLMVLLTAGIATMANAQATRTWVSGVGDDANPCSRTAPCKTFAGAISKTAVHGEIDVIDPGGFGTVTITKAITIDGLGPMASVLNAGGINGILVNAPTTDVVTLRNLSINGVGTGLNGIRILQANRVVIENVQIFGQTSRAVLLDSASPVKVFIRHCSFHDINATAVAILPAATVAHTMTIDESHIAACGSAAGTAGGVFANNGAKVVLRSCDISHNTASAVEASVGSDITVDNCDVSFNGGDGVKTSSSGTARISRSIFMNNTGSAVNATGGAINTFGDNRMAGNGSNNTGTAAAPGQQ
jgi:hypothetical protein